MITQLRRWLRWLFCDKDGHIVIAQFPNPPLVVALLGMGLNHVLHGQISHLAQLVGYGGLLAWSWLEFVDGVSYFRRLLGLVVLVSTLATVLA